MLSCLLLSPSVEIEAHYVYGTAPEEAEKLAEQQRHDMYVWQYSIQFNQTIHESNHSTPPIKTRPERRLLDNSPKLPCIAISPARWKSHHQLPTNKSHTHYSPIITYMANKCISLGRDSRPTRSRLCVLCSVSTGRLSWVG